MSRTDLLAAALFAGLSVLSVVVAVLDRRGRRRMLATARHLLVAWVIAATLVAGLSQHDLWPLSSWSLMTGAPRRDMGVAPVYLRMLAVDDTGREYAVDYRAVEPFAIEELMAWMRGRFLQLPAAQQARAAEYLLARINVARARVREDRPPGGQGAWLGPLRAPFHQLHPRVWLHPGDVPAAEFVALRVYGETWDLEERAADPTRVSRTLRYEYRRTP